MAVVAASSSLVRLLPTCSNTTDINISSFSNIGPNKKQQIRSMRRKKRMRTFGHGHEVVRGITRLNNIRVRATDGGITTTTTTTTTTTVHDVELTWQIVVGALAGVTPFIVAGIEFSKRIVAQKKCEVCGGSGLVLEEDNYCRCPNCGGFLPWQSWKRFFTG